MQNAPQSSQLQTSSLWPTVAPSAVHTSGLGQFHLLLKCVHKDQVNCRYTVDFLFHSTYKTNTMQDAVMWAAPSVDTLDSGQFPWSIPPSAIGEPSTGSNSTFFLQEIRFMKWAVPSSATRDQLEKKGKFHLLVQEIRCRNQEVGSSAF